MEGSGIELRAKDDSERVRYGRLVLGML